jgi:hypothetical protein
MKNFFSENFCPLENLPQFHSSPEPASDLVDIFWRLEYMERSGIQLFDIGSTLVTPCR